MFADLSRRIREQSTKCPVTAEADGKKVFASSVSAVNQDQQVHSLPERCFIESACSALDHYSNLLGRPLDDYKHFKLFQASGKASPMCAIPQEHCADRPLAPHRNGSPGFGVDFSAMAAHPAGVLGYLDAVFPHELGHIIDIDFTKYKLPQTLHNILRGRQRALFGESFAELRGELDGRIHESFCDGLALMLAERCGVPSQMNGLTQDKVAKFARSFCVACETDDIKFPQDASYSEKAAAIGDRVRFLAAAEGTLKACREYAVSDAIVRQLEDIKAKVADSVERAGAGVLSPEQIEGLRVILRAVFESARSLRIDAGGQFSIPNRAGLLEEELRRGISDRDYGFAVMECFKGVPSAEFAAWLPGGSEYQRVRKDCPAADASRAHAPWIPAEMALGFVEHIFGEGKTPPGWRARLAEFFKSIEPYRAAV